MDLLSNISVVHLARMFAPAPGRRARLFVYPADPTLAARLARDWQADLFAVVSNNGAAERLRTEAPAAQVVCAALGDVRISQGSMSAAVVELPEPSSGANDPWDIDGSATPDGVLRRASLALAPTGLLFAAVPAAAFTAKLWRGITAWYEVLGLGRIIEPRRSIGVTIAGRLRGRWISTSPPMPKVETLPLASALRTPLAQLPPAPTGQVLFQATSLPWPQALAEGRERGAWSDPALAARLAPESAWDVRPLMPLARGHLGQLIACGAFNNALLQGPDGPVLLKGQTLKIRAETGHTTEPAAKGEPARHLTTMRDAFRTNVTLLHLRTGEIQSVHSDETDGDGHAV